MRLANAITQVTGCQDLNIVVSSGEQAGQDEPHFHIHLIPRRANDGFDVPLPFDGSAMPDRTVLDAYAARIISALRDPVARESGTTERAKDAAPPKSARNKAMPLEEGAQGELQRDGETRERRAHDRELPRKALARP